MAFRRVSDIVLISLFAFALGLPAALFVFGRAQPKMMAGENRPPAPRPTVSMGRKALNRFPAKFEAYFQDRFPARELMLSEQARIKVDWLDTSSSEKVIVGRDGWLFMDEEKSENPGREVSQHEQCRLWAQEFRRRHVWLAQRDIVYIIVLTPEKHSIYPEFLPDAQGHAHGPTAADLLAEVVRSDPNMNVLVLREALLTRKGERQLYFRTDTHWNDEGAYVGYRALVERLASRFPQVRPLDRDDFDRGMVTTFTGDLSRILHLP